MTPVPWGAHSVATRGLLHGASPLFTASHAAVRRRETLSPSAAVRPNTSVRRRGEAGFITLETMSAKERHHHPSYLDSRFPGPDPYAPLADLPQLTLTSQTFSDGDRLPDEQLGGPDVSPQLSWSPGPEGTQTYAVTCFDPDAPTASGYWHWAVFNIPASVTSLPCGVGTEGYPELPEGAVVLRGDSGKRGYYGAKPPQGHGPHRYIFAVHAVGSRLDIEDGQTPTILGFQLNFAATARGLLWGWAEN